MENWLKIVGICSFVAVFGGIPIFGQGDSAATHPPEIKFPTLLVMEPVDISTQKTSAKFGSTLRNIFSESGKWDVFNRKQTQKKLKEYSISIEKPCKEYNCAFDAGNMFHANYVMFSTISQVRELYAFNLVMIDVLGSKIAWSHAGEVQLKSGGNPDEALVYRLQNLLGKLDTADFIKTDVESKGVIGVINFNTKSSYSKIIAERLATHIYSGGHFEIMGPSELGYLVKNLKVKPSAFTEQNMRDVGSDLGLDYMIYMSLKKKRKFYKIKLALYDVQNTKLVRDWPYESPKYRNILAFEEKFAASLNKSEAEFPKDRGAPGLTRWKWIASPVAMLSGVLMGSIAWQYHKAGSREFDKYQGANTLEELENRESIRETISEKDGARNIYFTLGGLMIGGSIGLWYF